MPDFPILSQVLRPFFTVAAGDAVRELVIPAHINRQTHIRVTVVGDDPDEFLLLALVPAPMQPQFQGTGGTGLILQVGQPLWPKGFLEDNFLYSQDSPAWYLNFAPATSNVGSLQLFVKQWTQPMAPGLERYAVEAPRLEITREVR